MKGHLNSGETYSLAQIFINCTNGKVVIPDLQRDYCWGGKGTLVTDFVDNIKKRFEDYHKNIKEWKDECLTCTNAVCRTKVAHSLMMGLLYGYYEENRPNLQLCDGQQRLTTLYLLIGLINRFYGDNSFRRFLISDYEFKEDDCEPNLIYDIRDSSRYFLGDLVCSCFIQENGEAVDGALSDYIRKQKWWFKTYETDPTIQSMLAAINEMQGLLHDMDKSKLKDFGCYVCNMLQFVYFDMGDSKNGEKTFVIINTTGEPLTATENLKPLVVTFDPREEEWERRSQQWERRSQQWEEMDNWFWKKRDKNEDTSDAGMKEFLRWVVAIHHPEASAKPGESVKKEEYYQWFTTKDYVFPYQRISFKEIKRAFGALKQLNGEDENEFIQECDLLAAPKGKMYDLKEYFVLLPTLKHFMKFEDKEASKRIYRFFRNLSRYTEFSTENNNVLLALRTIDIMKEKDICSLLDLKGQINTTYILTKEEEKRLTIIREKAKYGEEWRNKVEKAFEEISTHQILSGRISWLIECSGGEQGFDVDKFKINVRRFESLFPRERKYENVADDKMVLAFAAFCQDQERGSAASYPISDGDYRNFGYYASEWTHFLYGDKNHEEHTKVFGDFLQNIDVKDVEASEDSIINRQSTDSPMYFLIAENMSRAFKGWVWRKRLRIHPTSGLIRLLHNASYRSGKDLYLLGQQVLPCQESEQWSQWYFYSANVEEKEEYCLYTDHKVYDIAIDLLFGKVSEDQYRLRIFRRDNASKKKFVGLEALPIKFLLEENDSRLVSGSMSAKKVIDLLKNIQKDIEDSNKN